MITGGGVKKTSRYPLKNISFKFNFSAINNLKFIFFGHTGKNALLHTRRDRFIYRLPALSKIFVVNYLIYSISYFFLTAFRRYGLPREGDE